MEVVKEGIFFYKFHNYKFQSHRVFAAIISFTGELFKRGSEKTSGELQAGNRGANKRWMKRIIVKSDIHWL